VVRPAESRLVATKPVLGSTSRSTFLYLAPTYSEVASVPYS